MPHEVIMPALGMTQDTGLIVAWHKSPGEAVLVDDVLFEVETDKATMEVAAGHDGFVAALLAAPGQEVPVGDVVAVISATKPDAPISPSAIATPAAKSAPIEPKQNPTPEAPKPATAATFQPVPSALSNGRILASPKARRLALKQGLDLSRLAAMDHPPPYHVSDLQIVRKLPVHAAPTSAPTQYRRITARIPTSHFDEYLAWSRTESKSDAPVPSYLLATFATGALRDASNTTGPIRVQIETLVGAGPQMVDADRFTPLTQPDENANTPDLILRDITGSAITSLDLGPSTAPVLGLVTDGGAYEITLDFSATQLSDQTAIALITGFADRLSDPLRQLL
jgi:pyruvate dehydrogenase E2 component (dihydrolipoamide acetyltransferase)/2-oxoglutarate dehydrogenase E2 component (dihydrolipoamide succinyltransferase)